MTLLGVLLFPLLIAAGAAFLLRWTVTLKEFALQVGVQTAIIAVGYLIAQHQSLSSVEHLHGRITAKLHDDEKCCHCRMVCTRKEKRCDSRDPKTNRCTSSSEVCVSEVEVCDHARDYWWALETSLGQIPIDSCEPDSSSVPSRWTAAQLGEPVTKEHSYQNYLLADKQSLLRHLDKSPYADKIPKYPEVYDTYRVDPVMGPAPVGWQKAFREINADLGSKNQVDVTVLVTTIQDPTYAQAVEAKWLYGPKNSLNIILGVKDGTITWARVVTFSKVESLKVYLRDELQGMRLSDDIPGLVREVVATRFRRTAMADYEYLARAAKPSTGALIALYVVGVLLSVGLALWMHRKDVFK